jgi:hypothetical protein
VSGMTGTVKVTCTNNDRTVEAKILSRSVKRLVVALPAGPGAMEVVLTRDDVKKPFVGRMAGLEFTAPATA